MLRNGWILTIGSVGFMLFCVTGCQRQSEQKAQLAKEAIQPSKVAESPASVKQPPARISFEKTVYDLGEVGLSESKECRFKFKNTGDGLLKIGKIGSSCGCTVPSLSKKEYEPGQEGEIKVTYHTPGRPGPTSKRITVETNDSENSKINLTIKANAIQFVEAVPDRLRLSAGKENGGVSKIVLRSKDGKAFSIKNCTARGDLVKIDFDPNVKAGEFVLEPRFDMQQMKRYTSGGIKLNLTHPRCSLITLLYEVVAKFQAQPGRITLPNVEPNQPQIKEILIKNNDKKQFEIESISSSKGYIKVASQEPDGNDIRIKLQITPPVRKTNEMRFSDQISVKIKNDESLMIPCTGFYRRDIAKYKPARESKGTTRPGMKISP